MYPYWKVSTLFLENLISGASTLDFLGWEVEGVGWGRFLRGFAVERLWLGAEFGFGFGIGVLALRVVFFLRWFGIRYERNLW
jgi:hypothetical protein